MTVTHKTRREQHRASLVLSWCTLWHFGEKICWWAINHFLPRCMECRRGQAILSVCPSVCQTRNLWQNERKLCAHSYTTWKIIYPSFV